MQSIVSVTGLGQGYGARTVISGLDLKISAGTTLGLLGPNGAGKTTLLRTLATVTPPKTGSIEILGEAITSENSARIARRSIGYLPQDFGFYPNFSVYDFVCYCAWLREVPKKRIDSEVRRAIDSVGLGRESKQKMRSLSGGMLRRAGIATAIVGSPKLILLDEPTVGLDPAQRLEFRSLVKQFEDVAVVLSTHLVEDVSAVCDEVAVMSSGSLLFYGDPGTLAADASSDQPGDSPLERGYMTALARGGAGFDR
ncbi:ATP-binding cassette domain-containing protein [Streptomyces sp. MS1.HAVA.3]|uniref:ATP-binding cassette domain-containing protein n=1 Tax=Streptomyces caledonius TaxID=3134107 RepID=A0ABU8U234_9ACTN